MGLSFVCKFQYRRSQFELDASFEAGKGVTLLLGPSGSGKTTIVKLIAGLLAPAEGRIALDNEVLVDTSRRVFTEPEERRIGLVMQDSLLFPHLTTRENLVFASRWSRDKRAEAAITLEEVTDALEISHLLDGPAIALSGGQARRVALGRALLRNPKLLILDEPFTGLDTQLRESIVSALRIMFERWPVPTLIVTHDPAPLRSLADQELAVVNGTLLKQR